MGIEDVVHRLIDLSNAPGEEKTELHENVTPTAAASGESSCLSRRAAAHGRHGQ